MEAVTVSAEGAKTSLDYKQSLQSKKRLFVREVNFSYVAAFIAKHGSSGSVVATDFLGNTRDCALCVLKNFNANQPKGTLFCDGCEKVKDRIEDLKQKGVVVLFEVHETKLHETFKGEQFQRIHWNCPHDGRYYQDDQLPERINGFFRSCKLIQEAGDRVHIVLTQPQKSKKFFQSQVYDIVRAATLVGYFLVKKRRFDFSRYPGYELVDPDLKQGEMREFIWEKIKKEDFHKLIKESTDERRGVDILLLNSKLQILSRKKIEIKSEEFEKDTCLMSLECSTDEDSSDDEVSTA